MKIPFKAKAIGAIAIGRYAIFCKSLITAVDVAAAVQRKDYGAGIPCYGKITVKGKSYWFCRYGFVSDPDIYAKKLKRRKPGKSLKAKGKSKR